MSLRICHISTRLILGGSQENTLLSCEGQAERGHEVHLAYGPIHGPEGSMLERARAFRTGDGRAIATREIPGLVREVAPLTDARCARAIERYLREIDPDVVHTHSSKAGILGRIGAWRAGGRRGRPAVIHTVHGPPFMPPTGSGARRLVTGVKNAVYTLAERHGAARCHRIVSVADAMTDLFLSRGIGRPGLYTTIRSGMDTRAFLDEGAGRDEARAGLGIDPDAVVIGTVARLAEHKGHDDLLDALADDLRANPSWRLLWVGDGWWRGRLEARVAELGLAGRVLITGLVDPSRIPRVMRAMDVLAHPSSREGLPRTVPQALLSGVAVVAYDADGTREACIDEETGRLVAVGDVAGLRGAVRWMLDDDARRAATVERGRALCAEMFDADRMVDALDALYREVLADPGGAGRGGGARRGA